MVEIYVIAIVALVIVMLFGHRLLVRNTFIFISKYCAINIDKETLSSQHSDRNTCVAVLVIISADGLHWQ